MHRKGRRSEVGDRRLEVGGGKGQKVRRSEGEKKAEIRSQKSEVRNQKSEIRCQKVWNWRFLDGL